MRALFTIFSTMAYFVSDAVECRHHRQHSWFSYRASQCCSVRQEMPKVQPENCHASQLNDSRESLFGQRSLLNGQVHGIMRGQELVSSHL